MADSGTTVDTQPGGLPPIVEPSLASAGAEAGKVDETVELGAWDGDVAIAYAGTVGLAAWLVEDPAQRYRSGAAARSSEGIDTGSRALAEGEGVCLARRDRVQRGGRTTISR